MTKPQIIQWHDDTTDACGWLVIDKLINGVCGGGIFMHALATEREVKELAQAMSYKNSLQKIPFGGAKAGICYDHTKADADQVLARFLNFLKPWLETVWCTGADLNTNNQVINQIMSQIGLSSMFDALGKMIAFNLDIENQSSYIFSRMMTPMTKYFTLAEGATGYSVAQVIAEIFKHKSPRVFIQGFGTVGRSVAYFIQQWNIGKVVAICDIDGVIYRDDGIDCIELLESWFLSDAKSRGGMNQWLNSGLKAKYNFFKRDKSDDESYFDEALSKIEFDVLSPCAHRYAITESIVNSLTEANQIKYVIAGSNNVFDSSETRERAIEKGMRCIPEWISNCGAAILYEELLAIQHMPTNAKSYFQHIIRANILSFLNECELEKHSYEHWHKIFIQTANSRMISANKIFNTKEQYVNVSL